jgi:hypothetical protein
LVDEGVLRREPFICERCGAGIGARAAYAEPGPGLKTS